MTPTVTTGATAERPLGSFERAMVRTQHHSPFNVVLLLRFAPGPDAATIARALAALQARHGVLGCRIGGGRRRPAFVAGSRPVVVERVETGAMGRGESWRPLVERALGYHFDLASGPLCHALLAGAGADGRCELAVAFPHVVIDASSGACLVDELLGRLATAAAVGAAPATAAAPDLPPLEPRFPPRHRGARGRFRVAAALARELTGEVRFRLAARGLRRLDVAPAGTSRATTWELDEPATTALLAALRRRRLTLDATLAAAWAGAFAAARYGDRGGPVRTFTMVGLRRLVRPPVGDDALGAGWAMCRSILAAPGSAGDDAAFATAVRDQLHRARSRGDHFAAYLTAEAMMRLALGPMKQRMGELAVSYTGNVRVRPSSGPLKLVDLQVFVSTMDIGPALVVQHRLWEGRLLGGLVHHDHDLDAATVLRIGDDVRRRLLRLAAGRPHGASQ
jgi:hypothetical protein